MKTLKKRNLGFNSAEELYNNCPCYYLNCPCNPTIENANISMSDYYNWRETQKQNYNTPSSLSSANL